MLFSTLAISALTACVVAVPSAPGLNHLGSRDLDFTVKFHNTENCQAPGPERNYDAGSCLPLGDAAKGLEILDRRANCYVTSYTGGSCNGNGRKLDANGCWTLKGRQSIKFNCD